jgi:hypothetical protein
MFKHLFLHVSRLSNENFEEEVVKAGKKKEKHLTVSLLTYIKYFIPALQTDRDHTPGHH